MYKGVAACMYLSIDEMKSIVERAEQADRFEGMSDIVRIGVSPTGNGGYIEVLAGKSGEEPKRLFDMEV